MLLSSGLPSNISTLSPEKQILLRVACLGNNLPNLRCSNTATLHPSPLIKRPRTMRLFAILLGSPALPVSRFQPRARGRLPFLRSTHINDSRISHRPRFNRTRCTMSNPCYRSGNQVRYETVPRKCGPRNQTCPVQRPGQRCILRCEKLCFRR